MGDVSLGTIASGRRRLVTTHVPRWVVLFVALFIGLVQPSWAEEEEEPAPPTVEDILGNFDEDGTLHNETEKTYTLPDMGAFVAYYPATGDLATGLLVELYDEQDRRGLLNWFKYDLHLSEQRLGLALGRKVFPVIDITFSAVYSRDFDRNEDIWGFSVSLVDF